MTLPPEFDLITRYFKPLSGDGSFSLSDDAAVFMPPAGQEMVMAADALVEGVHFLPTDPPATLGRKLLRVNLSDLAAMGGAPFGYLMTLSLPRIDHAWMAAFVVGLATDQKAFGMRLLGGDTTGTTGPVVLSLTIIGTMPPGQAVRRSTARPGDSLWVTGSIGDSALGLSVLTGRVSAPEDVRAFLTGRYHLPRPRLMKIAGVASAAMDVSDGFVQDLGHLCRESGCVAVVDVDRIPLSRAARSLADQFADQPAFLEQVLTGGDDYELLLAVPPEREIMLSAAARQAGVSLTRIGRFYPGAPAVDIRRADGTSLEFGRGGWSHFQ